MKVCPHCNRDLPDDSVYCTYCGRPLEKVVQKETAKQNDTGSEEVKVKEPALKKNPRNNPFGKLGLFLFFIGLLGFDFVIATVVQSLTGDAKFVFMISSVVYVLAIVCGILSIYIDHVDKKKGYEQTGGFGFALMSILMSAYILMININSIFLV